MKKKLKQICSIRKTERANALANLGNKWFRGTVELNFSQNNLESLVRIKAVNFVLDNYLEQKTTAFVAVLVEED